MPETIRPVLACACLGLCLALVAGTPAGAHPHDPPLEDRPEVPVAEPSRDPGPPPEDDYIYPSHTPRSGDRPHIYLTGGAGVFAPWQGEADTNGIIQVMAASRSGHFRLGGEFEFREFRTQIFDVIDVKTRSYILRLLALYVINPGKVTPYLGAGFSVSINDIRPGDVENALPGFEVRSRTDAGLGIGFIGGVEVPLTPDLLFYIEGRVEAAYQTTSERGNELRLGDADYASDMTEQMGGASGLAGIRFRF